MAAILHTWRGAALENRDTAGGAIAPSAYDAIQFYDRGTLIISAAAGGALTLPAGLPIGWKIRVLADTSVTTAGGATVALDASYTVVGPASVGAAPFALLPGGGVDLEVISTNRIMVTPVGAGVSGNAAFGIVATRAALAAIAPADRADGMQRMVLSDMSNWIFRASGAFSALADTSQNVIVTPGAGTGRWVRTDKAFDLVLPFDFTTADAAILFTMPAPFTARFTALPYWDVTTGFTGGMASAIGVSSSNLGADFQVKGDLLGGATGDVTATLGTSGSKAGTVGDAFLDADAATAPLTLLQSLLVQGANTIRFDRITSVFTAGAGNVVIPISLQVIGVLS